MKLPMVVVAGVIGVALGGMPTRLSASGQDRADRNRQTAGDRTQFTDHRYVAIGGHVGIEDTSTHTLRDVIHVHEEGGRR